MCRDRRQGWAFEGGELAECHRDGHVSERTSSLLELPSPVRHCECLASGLPNPGPRASRTLVRRSDGNGTPSVTDLRTGTPRPGRSIRDGRPADTLPASHPTRSAAGILCVRMASTRIAATSTMKLLRCTWLSALLLSGCVAAAGTTGPTDSLGATIAGPTIAGASPAPAEAGPTLLPAEPDTTLIPARDSLPARSSQPLPGAPGVAFWALSDDRHVTVWTWHTEGALQRLVTLDTWPDPDPGSGLYTDRQVVVAPDGSGIAVAESIAGYLDRRRVRVFAADGRLLWSSSDPACCAGPLPWSPDGRRLAIASHPWTVLDLSSAASGAVTTVDWQGRADSSPGDAIVGFSADSSILYGLTGNVLPPDPGGVIAIDLDRGRVARLTALPGRQASASDRIGTSNGGWLDWFIDRATGRLLVARTGSSCDPPAQWAIVDGAAVTPLDLPRSNDRCRTPASPSWGPDGTLVLDQLTSDRPAVSHRIRTVRPERPDRDIGPAFAIEGGDFRANLAAVRGEYALAILCSVASGTAIAYLGCDEAVLVELPTARSAAVLAPGRSSDNRGFFFAGWVP